MWVWKCRYCESGRFWNQVATGRPHKIKTPFEHIVQIVYQAPLSFIPPASPTFNSDVETLHRLVEYEFYDIEFIHHKQDLIDKMYTWLIDFNYLRLNSYKDNMSPIQLAQLDVPNITKSVFNLPPMILDQHRSFYFETVAPQLMNSLSHSTDQAFITESLGKPDPFDDPELKQILSKWDPFQLHSGGYNVPSLDNIIWISIEIFYFR